MDVVIICHTEFGFVDGNDVIFDKKATDGVSVGAANLATIANKHGARVTFAVCPEAAPYFPKNLGHEIGLHIHPGWQKISHGKHSFWVGDEYLRKNCDQSNTSTFLRDYSYQQQRGMIQKGKEYLGALFGVLPKTFVAGRWSLNNDTVSALQVTGFTHDFSGAARGQTQPGDWKKLARITMPYHPSANDYQQKGSEPLLMVPVSQYFPKGNINPEAFHRVGVAWMKAAFVEYHRQGLPLFHICLHSPSMTDGRMGAQLDELLAFIASHKGVNFIFGSEVKEYSPVKPKTNMAPYLLAVNKNIIRSLLKR